MILVDIGKCTGCRSCETVCSFFHKGRISNRMSRIKVLNLYETGIDGAVACVQCFERYCFKCPENAISEGRFGEVVVQPTICTRCGVCVRACPIGAIEIHDNHVYVCDLCGGKPKCIDACTEGAIQYIPSSSFGPAIGPRLEEVKASTADMNPSEKRRFYIEKLGNEVRKTWGEHCE